MVNYFVDDQRHKTPTTDGWDFCRGMQLLGLFYLVGYIDRKQMVDFSCAVGKIMQRHFSSWEALCESYLAGHAQWCKETLGSGAEAEKDIAERRACYEGYKKMKHGPYRLPWKMPLVPTAAADSTVVGSGATNYFQQWLAQEEKWIAAYRRKAAKILLLVVMPAVVVIMGALMAVIGLVGGESGFALLETVQPGVMVGLLVTLPVYGFVMHRLSMGRISHAIQMAAKQLEMDASERERLGMEMLAALQSSSSHLDYQDKVPHSQTTPARLVVSKSYFYQTGSRMHIVLIRRSEVEFIEAGQERKMQGVSANTWQSFVLHTVYFYYRSGRERRLEGDKSPDNGMGFFDPTMRDRALAMMKQQL